MYVSNMHVPRALAGTKTHFYTIARKRIDLFVVKANSAEKFIFATINCKLVKIPVLKAVYRYFSQKYFNLEIKI